MIYITEDKYKLVQNKVSRLYRRYGSYINLSYNQVPAFILNELQDVFEDDPTFEVITLAVLANIFSHDKNITDYIRAEYDYCKEVYLIVIDDSLNNAFKSSLKLLYS